MLTTIVKVESERRSLVPANSNNRLLKVLAPAVAAMAVMIQFRWPSVSAPQARVCVFNNCDLPARASMLARVGHPTLSVRLEFSSFVETQIKLKNICKRHNKSNQRKAWRSSALFLPPPLVAACYKKERICCLLIMQTMIKLERRKRRRRRRRRRKNRKKIKVRYN